MTKVTFFTTAFALSSLTCAQAATIMTSATAPATGSFFADSFNTGPDFNNYRINNTSGSGQSFAHTTAGGVNYNLSAITVLGSDDNLNSATESANDLVLRIFSGNGLGGTQVGSDITFSGTFNARDQFIELGLSAAEQAAIGPLTSGTTYTFGLFQAVGGAVDFRIRRTDASDPYAAGQSHFNGAPRTGEDLIFFVNGAPIPADAIPEPSRALLLGLAVLCILGRRARV